jgi:uncharacterized protein YjbI with pentapeptide repeats
MGDGTKENPFTRADVLKLIEQNGGNADGLDLSFKKFEKGIDLKGLALQGIIIGKALLIGAHFEGALLRGSNFQGTNLQEAFFQDANIQGAHLGDANLNGARLPAANLEGAFLQDACLEKAFLWDANLQRAFLQGAHLQGAFLQGTHLAGAFLYRAVLSPDTGLENADWGDYVLGEEKSRKFDQAMDTYRRLKTWYANAGMHDIAARFYYREKEAWKKGAKRRRDRIAGWLSSAFFGHGEGWKRILLWIAGFILAFAGLYYSIGTLTSNTFLDSLYYSAVSFIALGYGSWVKEATGAVKILGVCETFLGFFMMTLLLVTFVRKWTR